jgi:hypothetical protein
LAIVLAVLYAPSVASACPDCNIHNYLAKSVASSKNIIVAKAVKQVDDETALVEVTGDRL